MDDFVKIIEGAYAALSVGVETIGGSKILNADVAPIFDEAGRNHYAQIVECWHSKVRPILSKYSYIDISSGLSSAE